MATVAETVRDWLRECPLIGENDQFNINYLDGEPVSYTLDESAGSSTIKRYMDGTERKVRAFALASTSDYGPDFLQQVANSGFWDQLVEWIEQRNHARQLPKLPEGKTASKIEVASAQYLYRAGATTARYQVQLRLEYTQKFKRGASHETVRTYGGSHPDPRV